MLVGAGVSMRWRFRFAVHVSGGDASQWLRTIDVVIRVPDSWSAVGLNLLKLGQSARVEDLIACWQLVVSKSLPQGNVRSESHNLQALHCDWRNTSRSNRRSRRWGNRGQTQLMPSKTAQCTGKTCVYVVKQK